MIKTDEKAKKCRKEILKMKKFKRNICLALAVLLTVSLLASCGSKVSNSPGKPVTLTWVMSGSEQSDAKMVWEKFNEELNKKEGFENYKIDFKLIPFSDFGQKFMLMQTSGEKMDIVSTYNAGLGERARDGTYLDLTDMMEEFAPDILKEIPEWALDLCKVDGRQFAITNYQQMSEAKYGTALQADEADKYFDFDALKKAQASSPKLNQAIYDVYEDYLDKLKANGELHLGMYPGTTWMMMKGYDYVVNYLWVFEREGDDVKVEHIMETDTYQLMMKNADKFFKKGFIRKDVLSADLGKEKGLPNGYDIWQEMCFKGAEDSHSLQYGMDVRLVEPEKDFYISNKASAGGNAILAATEFPEEALKFLNLMNTEQGKDLYRLLVYGIEGKHYNMVEGSDIRIEPIGYVGNPGAADAPYGLNKWIVGNCALAFEAPTEPEGWLDYVFNDWNVNAKPSKIAGFVLDTESVDVEFSQIRAVTSEYRDVLVSGALEDYQATYKEAMKKLEIAGLSKVKAEIQKQVDEFLAKKK